MLEVYGEIHPILNLRQRTKTIDCHILRLFFLNSEIQINYPHFTGQSYLQVKTSQLINSIDLTFATEHHNGLLLYCDDKSREFYFIISIRNKIIDIT